MATRPLLAGQPKARKIAFVSAALRRSIRPTARRLPRSTACKLLPGGGLRLPGLLLLAPRRSGRSVDRGRFAASTGRRYELRGARLGTYQAQLLFHLPPQCPRDALPLGLQPAVGQRGGTRRLPGRLRPVPRRSSARTSSGPTAGTRAPTPSSGWPSGWTSPCSSPCTTSPTSTRPPSSRPTT